MKKISALCFAGLTALTGLNAGAGTDTFAVSFAVLGVRSDAGVLKSVLCTEQDKFPADCRIRQEAKAIRGVVNIEFQDVPAGEYAFAVFHDENTNGRIDMAPNFIPMEGMAFGKDAMGRTGVPAFTQSAITISESGKNIVTMRYLKF